MANKVGALIKEARTGAKLTQEQLAKKVDNVTAADISKAERGEKELTQTALKQIAKATGVTQTSLIEAAKASTYGESSAKKTTSTAKKTTSTAKKTTTTAKKEDEFKLSSTEKKLVELYRAADSDTKKKVTAILKGEDTGSEDLLENLLGNLGSIGGLGDLAGLLGKK